MHELDVVYGLRDAILPNIHRNIIYLCQVSIYANEVIESILSDKFFFSSFRNNKLGIKIFCAFTAVMLAFGGFVTVKHKFLPTFDVLWRTGTELYIAPWTRIPPYCVGVACGWFLNSYRKTFSVSDVRLASLTLATVNFHFHLIHIATAKLHVFHIIVFAGACASQHNLP